MKTFQPINKAAPPTPRPTHTVYVWRGKLTTVTPWQEAALTHSAAGNVYGIDAAFAADAAFYSLALDGENLVATPNEGDRNAVFYASRGHAYENRVSARQFCYFHARKAEAEQGDSHHLEALHHCFIGDVIHGCNLYMSDVELNRFLADPDAGERNNERFARVAVGSIIHRAGDVFTLDEAYATWQLAAGARDGILLRLKIDGQLDQPKFRLDLTDAKFKELFCAPVTPMVVPRIITAAYLAGQPFSLRVSRKDVQANTGTFRIQQLVGVRWSDVPSRNDPNTPASISETATWTPPADQDATYRAVGSGFRGIDGTLLEDVVSEPVQVVRQSTQPETPGA